MTTDSEYSFDSYIDLIKSLLEQVSQLPTPLRQPIEKELNELLHIVEDIRSPRFMVIGRRGAGKSSLINAIFDAPVARVGAVEAQTGKPRWYEYEQDGKKAEILDTRGILEGGKPQEEDSAATPQDSILEAIRKKCPDIVLFLCKATEVDSAINESLDVFEEIISKLEDIHKYNPPIVGILTQCDQLAPADINRLPTDDEEKNQNISHAVELLNKHLKSRKTLNDNFVEVIPIAAFVRFREKDGKPDKNRDLRWNIDRLTELLVDELPKGPDIAFARLARVRKFQRKIAGNIVNICSTACGAVATSPIPMSDLPVLAGIQLAMVVVIAYISGRELSFQAAGEFLAAFGINVGSGFVLREAARSLVKLLPGFGSAISAGVAFVGTQALGQAARAYFVDEIPLDKVKKEYDSETKFS
jgi:uncharacterized protein (DUF697 family)/predicted GTPase